MDCFVAEPVIGPRFARTRWLLAMTILATSVAATTRRAKHFAYSEIARVVQPFLQKYFSFRKQEIMI